MRKDVYICDACNKEYHRSAEDRNPMYLGWIEINGYYFCPDHEITVNTNDGGCIKFNRIGRTITDYYTENMYRVTPNDKGE